MKERKHELLMQSVCGVILVIAACLSNSAFASWASCGGMNLNNPLKNFTAVKLEDGHDAVLLQSQSQGLWFATSGACQKVTNIPNIANPSIDFAVLEQNSKVGSGARVWVISKEGVITLGYVENSVIQWGRPGGASSDTDSIYNKSPLFGLPAKGFYFGNKVGLYSGGYSDGTSTGPFCIISNNGPGGCASATTGPGYFSSVGLTKENDLDNIASSDFISTIPEMPQGGILKLDYFDYLGGQYGLARGLYGYGGYSTISGEFSHMPSLFVVDNKKKAGSALPVIGSSAAEISQLSDAAYVYSGFTDKGGQHYILGLSSGVLKVRSLTPSGAAVSISTPMTVSSANIPVNIKEIHSGGRYASVLTGSGVSIFEHFEGGFRTLNIQDGAFDYISTPATSGVDSTVFATKAVSNGNVDIEKIHIGVPAYTKSSETKHNNTAYMLRTGHYSILSCALDAQRVISLPCAEDKIMTQIGGTTPTQAGNPALVSSGTDAWLYVPIPGKNQLRVYPVKEDGWLAESSIVSGFSSGALNAPSSVVFDSGAKNRLYISSQGSGTVMNCNVIMGTTVSACSISDAIKYTKSDGKDGHVFASNLALSGSNKMTVTGKNYSDENVSVDCGIESNGVVQSVCTLLN